MTGRYLVYQVEMKHLQRSLKSSGDFESERVLTALNQAGQVG